VLEIEPAQGRAVKLYTTHEHWLVCPMHVLLEQYFGFFDGRGARCVTAYDFHSSCWRRPYQNSYSGFQMRATQLVRQAKPRGCLPLTDRDRHRESAREGAGAPI
jgi:hypothetical protein